MREQAPAAAGGGETAGMRAAVFRTFGPPGVLRLEHDFPKPVRRQGQGQVLLRVAAAGVNPIDWKTRKGDVPRFAVTRPKVRIVLCRTTHTHTGTRTCTRTHMPLTHLRSLVVMWRELCWNQTLDHSSRRDSACLAALANRSSGLLMARPSTSRAQPPFCSVHVCRQLAAHEQPCAATNAPPLTVTGTYAELVVAHESCLLPVPEGWSFAEAAAVPLAAMTAWQVRPVITQQQLLLS